MKRVLSGIKPSGDITLGNYLGAMKRWGQQQEGTENFYFVPDLHALTVRPDPAELKASTLNAVAWLLAVGVDPKKSFIFVQSQIPAHAELSWIFNNYVTMGELSRMTQFKDKSRRVGQEGQLVGLFTYPTLMAADILLYDADEVPVGEDQKQHVELARDIAGRFNNLYGDTFKLPTPVLPDVGARIMNLLNPKEKMSKSDADASGNIMLTDKINQIEAKVMGAVTDSDNKIAATPDKPALANLLQIYSLVVGEPIKAVEEQFSGSSYVEFKQALAREVASEIRPLQAKYQQAMGNRSNLDSILEAGKVKATAISTLKLQQIKQKIGLL